MAVYGSRLEMGNIITLVQDTLDEKIEFHPNRATFDGKAYEGCSTDSLRGTRVYCNHPSADRRWGELRFKMPGKALAAATMNEIRDMCAILREIYSATCGRFDGAIDDYSKTLSLDAVKAAQDANNFAHAEVIGYHESGERGKRERGKTITFGSRTSESYLRVYDKSIESHGEIDAIRYEVEFKGDKADLVFREWTIYDFQR